jgi:hypothetical protein
MGRYTSIRQSGKATDEALPVNKMKAPSAWDKRKKTPTAVETRLDGRYLRSKPDFK